MERCAMDGGNAGTPGYLHSFGSYIPFHTFYPFKTSPKRVSLAKRITWLSLLNFLQKMAGWMEEDIDN